MKFDASVSLAALALAGCAANTSSTAPVAEVPAAAVEAPQAGAAALPYPQTPEGARQFIADVEKDLFDLSVIGGRAQWVNATYINDDTDALAAYFGTIGTEMDVRLAGEAARYQKASGLSTDTARKLVAPCRASQMFARLRDANVSARRACRGSRSRPR